MPPKPPSIRPGAKLGRRTPKLLPTPTSRGAAAVPQRRIVPPDMVPTRESPRVSPIEAARARVEQVRVERESAAMASKPPSLRSIDEQNEILREIRDAIVGLREDLQQLVTGAGSAPTDPDDGDVIESSQSSGDGVSDIASDAGDPEDAASA